MEEAGREDVVRVSDDVIMTIAGMALAEVKGVASTPAGFVGGLFSRKGPAKGVKVETDGNTVSLDVTVVVEYGARIPDVAAEIQTKLRRAIEEMTGKFVRAVNVTVQGIRPPSGAPGIEPDDEDTEAASPDERRED
ncbi:MAG: Asp23/Gls24 family envelope stress response protein [Verrucomicrobia bacterium]|nr:Asp23/Gls24 family envelope stress response protein [Verrucomicrobiota bacterium]